MRFLQLIASSKSRLGIHAGMPVARLGHKLWRKQATAETHVSDIMTAFHDSLVR